MPSELFLETAGIAERLPGETTGQFMAKNLGLLMQLKVTYTDGTVSTFISDEIVESIQMMEQSA